MTFATETTPYWQATSRIAAPEGGELPRDADVAVIGCGMMGAGTAMWLARAGMNLVVLEGRLPGFGASGRSAGMMDVGTEQQLAELAGVIGEGRARELYIASLENLDLVREVLSEEVPHDVPDGGASRGILSMWVEAEEERTWHASAPFLSRMGHPVEILDRAACQRVMGAPLAAAILGGALRPKSVLLHPLDYLNAVLQITKRAGGIFVYGAQVLALHPKGKSIDVETRRGCVTARTVVIANNEGLGALIPDVADELRVVRDVLAVARLSPPWPPPLGFGVHFGSLYGRYLESGLALIGGGAAAPAKMLEVFEREVFGTPKIACIESSWSGVMTYTADELPLLGAYQAMPGVWVIGGFGGQGHAFSQWAPRTLASAILGSDEALIPSALRLDRFTSRGGTSPRGLTPIAGPR